ncbi:MAG: putative bifunctional diguanylate cyclase/phosphodiesterase [Halothiobacillus sp.]
MNSIHEPNAPQTSIPTHPDYTEAWVWLDLDSVGRIEHSRVLATQVELSQLDLILGTIAGEPGWPQTTGRAGPSESLTGWIWRARWLASEQIRPLVAEHLTAKLPSGSQRLLHISAYPRVSPDAMGWLDRLPDCVVGRDASQAVVFLNQAAQKLSDPSLLEQLVHNASFEAGQHALNEQSACDRQGRRRIFQRMVVQAPPAAALHDFILLHEITQIKALEYALGDNEQLMRNLIDATPDIIIIKDGDGRWLLANAAGLALYHLQGKIWWGKTDAELAKLTPLLYHEGLETCIASDNHAWEARQLTRALETVPRPDGSMRIFDVLKLPSFNEDGRRKVLIIIGRDVTERHVAQQRYETLASQDELTGLLNRHFFHIEAQRWMDELGADSNQKLALIEFDLDYFRSINDSYGHPRGDQLLQQMALRLRDECSVERILIARLGGDEFALLLPTDGSPAALNALGSRVKALAASPFHIEHLTLLTTASTGIVIWPDHGQTIQELLHQADSAMYAAKEQGRNGHAVFSPAIAAQQNWRAMLLTALRQGQAERRFFLVYQVQQNANSLAITGVEALLRWTPHTPDLAAGPDQFVPLLEQSGLIIDVGGWVLLEACLQIARWREPLGECITVAVNVSSIQLHAPCFVGRVRAALAQSGINPSLLELELTESALVNDPHTAASTLAELKALGVQLALDDFGTGYSSLSYLTQFAFDRLKIDQSFVRDILDDPKDLEIVKAIIAMGHALGLEVVAEGVETVAERDLLEALGCDSFQGYLVGRPGKPEEIYPMLGVGLL